MKLFTFGIATLAILSGVSAESIIVFCNNANALKRAKAIVEAAGGNIFYDYDALGLGFAATYPAAVEALQATEVFQTDCHLTKDSIVSIDKPGRLGTKTPVAEATAA